MTHPGAGSEQFCSVQRVGHDQLLDSSQIGWHQGEVSSIINLLASNSLGSMFLWSAVFIGWRSASRNNSLGMCVRPLSISFRELGVRRFCYVAELVFIRSPFLEMMCSFWNLERGHVSRGLSSRLRGGDVFWRLQVPGFVPNPRLRLCR